MLPRIGVLIIVYVVSGWLGLQLAIPPGYVTAVFPPAGICLGALLIWGARVWPGVWLGSLALNLLVAWRSSAGVSTGAVELALAIATGSTLQSLAGHYLIERWQPGSKSLEVAERVIFLLLLGGPLACLTASLFGSLSLVAIGRIGWAGWPFSFWSWWVGDTIGVFLFTPMVLILVRLREPAWRRQVLTTVVPILVIFPLVVALFFQTNRWESQRIEATFHDQARTVVENLRHDIDIYEGAVGSVQGLFEATDDVTPEQFYRFTHRDLSQYPAILALEFLPQVTNAQRPAFEQHARTSGLTGYFIKALGANGMEPAPQKADYFPVYHVEPMPGNGTALGFDISSVPSRAAALQYTLEHHTATITPKIILVTTGQPGLLLLEPVYDMSSSADGQQGRVRGVALGAFDLPRLVGQTIPNGTSDDISIRIDDVTDTRHIDTLFQSQGHRNQYPGLQWTVPLVFANRNWSVQLSANESFVARQRSLISWVVLAGGLTSTAMLQMLLLIITGRTRSIEKEVEARTNALAEREAYLHSVFNNNPDAILVIGGEGRIQSANSRAAQLFGYTEATLPSQAIETLIPECFRGLLSGGQIDMASIGGVNLFGRHADGTTFPAEVIISPLRLPKETLAIAIVRDVTQRHAQEQRLSDALREKETLLKEVYHRVKNNLQVTQSLLNLESRGLAAGPAKTAMDDVGSRIRAMALVHEKLYQSGNLTSISLKDYVNDLISQIRQSGALGEARLSVDQEIADIQVGVDAAIPLGLLINELFSNCVKHAFPDAREGHIRVLVKRDVLGTALTITDDGVGLPPGFNQTKLSSMGLRLAKSLALQLKGALLISSDHGTTVSIIGMKI
jgi:PAS domain S-box-containing protein